MAPNPLHDARVQRGLTLENITDRTRLSPRVVMALDEGRFADVPGGLYARAYVRAFALAVGLSAETALEAVIDRLPAAPEQFTAAIESEPAREDLNSRAWARVAAAMVIDTALLAGISAFVVNLVAQYCGVTIGGLLRMAPGPLMVLCTPTWVLYHVLLGHVGGRTAGTLLCGLKVRSFAGLSMLRYPPHLSESSRPPVPS